MGISFRKLKKVGISFLQQKIKQSRNNNKCGSKSAHLVFYLNILISFQTDFASFIFHSPNIIFITSAPFCFRYSLNMFLSIQSSIAFFIAFCQKQKEPRHALALRIGGETWANDVLPYEKTYRLMPILTEYL